MDERERDEILWRLDERTKKVDEHLNRIDDRLNDVESTVEVHDSKIQRNENTIGVIKKAGGGTIGFLTAVVSAAAAKFFGMFQI